MSCWSDLNNDILEQITSLLSLPDRHRFSAVCRSWRWVAKHQQYSSPAKQLPWLVMRQVPSTRKRKFFSLTERKEYCIDIPQLYEQRVCGSSFGWLFIIDRKLRSILLLNPFTREHYQLPNPPFDYDNKDHYRIAKFILSDDPSTTSDFMAVLFNCYGTAAASWRRGDIAWTWILSTMWTLQDAIFFRGHLYAISPLNEIFKIELRGVNQRVESARPSFWHPNLARLGSYLVDFLGELLFVERFAVAGQVQAHDQHPVTSYFLVYMVNLGEKEHYPIPCTDLGDYAIFLGASSPMVLDSKQFPGCKRNSIYFTDMFYKRPSYKYDNDDIGVYDMERKTVEACHPPEMLIFHPFSEPPIWLTPNCRKL